MLKSTCKLKQTSLVHIDPSTRFSKPVHVIEIANQLPTQ